MVVAQIASEGMAVIVVVQFASTVLGVANRALVVIGGKVALAAPADEHLVEQLAEMYLGENAH